MATVTLQEFCSFHSIDRELFSRMINNLGRNPDYSMLSIALWLWLEEMGFPNIIFQMKSLPDHVLERVAQEACVMINFLEHGLPPSPNSSISLVGTRSLTNSTLTPQYLLERRTRALNGIYRYMEEVCRRAFHDILLSNVDGATSGGSCSSSVAVMTLPMINRAAIGPSRYSIVNDHQGFETGVPEWNDVLSARQKARSVFMTFARGSPVSETEIREYLIRNYGHCVESIRMEEVPPTQQPLFARVIFHSEATVSQILGQRPSVKFVIYGGKQVMVRRWVMQQGR